MLRRKPVSLEQRRGRRELRKRVTRRELLAAGRRLFGEEGLYEPSIEDLSRHAGIAKGTLYGYFANKRELIEAVVAAGFSELLGHVHREAHGARDHAELVARVVQAHLDFFDENPDLMRIFHQVRGLLKFGRPEGFPLRRVLTKYLATLAHVLALHRPAGRGGDQAQLEMATMLFGAISGVSSTRASLHGGLPKHNASRATVRALVAVAFAYEDLPVPRARRPQRPTRASEERAGRISRHRILLGPAGRTNSRRPVIRRGTVGVRIKGRRHGR